MRYSRRTSIRFGTLAVMLLVGVVLFVGIFSIPFGMQADEHGNMAGCPFMSDQSAICSMGAAEHSAKWQQLFTATFFQSSYIISLILLLIFFVLLSGFVRAPNSFPVPVLSPPIPQNKPETKLFNHLVIIFLRGILNPKIYDFAVL